MTATALTLGLTAPAANAAVPRSASQEINLAALEGLNVGAVLEALGISVPDLGDVLEIPSIPGVGELPVNVITTGPPFGALGILGLNPTWVPAFPDRIAEEINNTPYGGIDTDITIPITVPNPAYQPAYNLAYNVGSTAPKFLGGGGCQAADTACRTAYALNAVRNIPQTISATPSVPIELPNLRIPIVLAFGLGSLATGMAYPDVVADLPNQPGGTAEGAEAGTSLTILPLILLRNPGRADGGVAARFAPLIDPLLALFGQNSVVTPEVDVETDGGAVLVPIKVDATVEYDPLSDFAAWPNPFTLANNGAAFLFPTYILRGSDITSALPQVLEPVLGGVLTNVLSGAIGDGLTVSGIPIVGSLPLPRSVLVPLVNGLLGLELPDGEDGFFQAINAFITIEQNALPLLEPFRYPADVANLFTGGAFGFTNPFADAVEPALKILVNLGYTNVTQDMTNPLDPYPRDFAGNFGSEYAPFFTFPEGIEWDRVPEDLFTALVAGTQSAFFSGGIPGVNPGVPVANPLAVIAGLLGLDGGIPELPDLLDAFPGLGDILGADLGLPTGSLAALAAPQLDSNDPLTRIGEVVANTLYEAFERQAPVGYTPSTGPVDSAFDVAEGLGASGLRLLAASVLGPTRLLALAEGGPEALADLIENTVDTPLWVADPALYGLRDALPEALGGGADGSIEDFRDRIWALTEEINEALLGALDDLPGAPSSVAITGDQARAGVQDEQVERTLEAAQQAPEVPSAGQPEVPPAGDAQQNSANSSIVLEEGTDPTGGDDKVSTNGNSQWRGGPISKAIREAEKNIERSVGRIGDRIDDAADRFRDAITPKPRTTVDNDDDGGEQSANQDAGTGETGAE
ncbi:PE-PPE domain-containing protein [Mycobacterium sp. PS03-16]|uniref:PE-PPE domain-containing protein n=1 Tax=Mycobacterium sp. PS03-16 TaxID=2559611 RepID=UPI001FD73691|nr:PE-PPE domain-containing protein [Mycobacterium sp. PS03-16]